MPRWSNLTWIGVLCGVLFGAVLYWDRPASDAIEVACPVARGDSEWVPCWQSADGAVTISVRAEDADKCAAGLDGPILAEPGIDLRFEHRRLPFQSCMTGPDAGEIGTRCLGCDRDCDGDVDLRDWHLDVIGRQGE